MSARYFRVVDDYTAEDRAMLQALYSRNPSSIDHKLEQLRGTSERGRFMDKYYIGYGHKSIGDCGVTTVFCENVSLYEAKLIEDSPLFAGQESSTRYLDFSNMRPENIDFERDRLIQFWLDCYEELLEAARAYFSYYHPDSKANQHLAFDLARCLLPLGVKTNVAWTTSLSHAREHIQKLAVHPHRPARELAAELHEKLKAGYPNSFRSSDVIDAHEKFTQAVWQDPVSDTGDYSDYRSGFAQVDYEPDALGRELTRRDDFNSRVHIKDYLDFGSLRDLHRHRPALIPLPYKTLFHHATFLEKDLYGSMIERIMGADFVGRLQSQFANLGSEDEDLVTYPLGSSVPCELITGIGHFKYIAELRSRTDVHPTLRAFIFRSCNQLRKSTFGRRYVDTLNIDNSPAAFMPVEKRAEQTIEEKF